MCSPSFEMVTVINEEPTVLFRMRLFTRVARHYTRTRTPRVTASDVNSFCLLVPNSSTTAHSITVGTSAPTRLVRSRRARARSPRLRAVYVNTGHVDQTHRSCGKRCGKAVLVRAARPLLLKDE